MLSAISADEDRPAKKPKRTYRACHPCRSRKLKCGFGDPNHPWNGPCERCIREQRDCIRSKPPFVRPAVPRKSDLSELAPTPIKQAAATMRPAVGARATFAYDVPDHERGAPQQRPPSSIRPVPIRPSPAMVQPHLPPSNGPSMSPGGPKEASDDDNESQDDDDDELIGGDTLVRSNLENPSDALKLLASASSLQYRSVTPVALSRKEKSLWPGNNASMWAQWEPIQEGYLTVHDARALFSFFELEMAPLYPLLHPSLFEAYNLEVLVKSESLLLGSIIVIAARYSKILADSRGDIVHRKMSQWVRMSILDVMAGEPSLRSVSSVEALLLLSEWPMLPRQQGQDSSCDPPSEEASLLKPSLRYDAYSWTHIGLAVRLAQELGIHDVVNPSLEISIDKGSPKTKRMLKTWIYCYNAERHIAIRLGRNAVLQAAMSTRWWESFSAMVCDENRAATGDVWTSDTFILGSIAQLLAAIQDHLYPSKEVTRSLLNSGVWEGFLRSVRLEIRYTKRACKAKLDNGSVDSALLKIELDYVVLYAYSLSLRALQGKLRRRRQAGDLHYHSPSLLNTVEGPWIMEALSAARSIIENTLTVLEDRRHLPYCPSRIFHYILFATTFLYKALAAGMVEYGEQNMAGLLDRVVTALGDAAIDDEHFLYGFAILLKRLGKHWRTSNPNTIASSSILNRPGAERIEAAEDLTPSHYDGIPGRPISIGPTTTQQQSTGTSTSHPEPNANRADDVTSDDLTFSDLQSFQLDLGSVPVSGHVPDDPAHVRAHATATGSGGGGSLGISPSSAADEFLWNFDPTLQMPAAGHEQDLLFKSIWDNAQQDASVSTSNLYATLLGDTITFP